MLCYTAVRLPMVCNGGACSDSASQIVTILNLNVSDRDCEVAGGGEQGMVKGDTILVLKLFLIYLIFFTFDLVKNFS